MKNFIFLASISGLLTAGFISAAQGMDKYPYGSSYGRSGGQRGVVSSGDLDAREAALLAELAEIQDKKKSQDQKGQFSLDSRKVFIKLKDDQKLPDLSYLTKLESLKVVGADLKPGQLKELEKLKIKNLILYDFSSLSEVRKGIIPLLPKTLESLFVTDCHAKDLMALATHPNLKQFYTGSMNGTFRQGFQYVIDWSQSKIQDFGTSMFRFGINNLVDTELGLKKITFILLPGDFEETEKKLQKSRDQLVNPIFQTLESLHLILDGKENLEYLSKGLISKIRGLFPNLQEVTFSKPELQVFSLKIEEKSIPQGTLIQNKSLGKIMGDEVFDGNPPQKLTCRFSSKDLGDINIAKINFNLTQPRPLFEKLQELNLILDQDTQNQKEQLGHVFNQEWISKIMGFFPNLKQITLWGAEKSSAFSLNITKDDPRDSFLSKKEWDSLI